MKQIYHYRNGDNVWMIIDTGCIIWKMDEEWSNRFQSICLKTFQKAIWTKCLYIRWTKTSWNGNPRIYFWYFFDVFSAVLCLNSHWIPKIILDVNVWVEIISGSAFEAGKLMFFLHLEHHLFKSCKDHWIYGWSPSICHVCMFPLKTNWVVCALAFLPITQNIWKENHPNSKIHPKSGPKQVIPKVDDSNSQNTNPKKQVQTMNSQDFSWGFVSQKVVLSICNVSDGNELARRPHDGRALGRFGYRPLSKREKSCSTAAARLSFDVCVLKGKLDGESWAENMDQKFKRCFFWCHFWVFSWVI